MLGFVAVQASVFVIPDESPRCEFVKKLNKHRQTHVMTLEHTKAFTYYQQAGGSSGVFYCAWCYRAPGLLQLAGRHHGVQLLTAQVSAQSGLWEASIASRWAITSQPV